jgi:hypothetical protein
MIEYFLIAQITFKHLTDANYVKVKNAIKANRTTSEQTITNILGMPPTGCGQDSYQKNCYWREGKRVISMSWMMNSGRIFLPDYQGFN